MRKKAQEAIAREISSIVTANDYQIVKESFVRLTSLADILDSLGDEKDADRIDDIVKEAAGIWDFLLSGLGGAATTTNSGGSILDAIKGGNLGAFFDKKTIETMITKFLLGGAIGTLAASLVEVLTEKVPFLKWFGDAPFIKLAIEGALTYAVMKSDFVSKLVDGIVDQIEKVIGSSKPDKQPPALNAQPAQQALPGTTEAPAAKEEGAPQAQFQYSKPSGA